MVSGIVFDDVILDQDRVSDAVLVRRNDFERISFQNIISGSADGLFFVQISNDATDKPNLIVNWFDYPDSSTNILGITQLLINIKDLSFKWIRLAYIHNSGTGVVSSSYMVVRRYLR